MSVDDFGDGRSKLVSQGQSHLARSEQPECAEQEVAAQAVRNSRRQLPATGFSAAVFAAVGSLLVAAGALLVALARRPAASDRRLLGQLD
ncbi:MAG: LPXTG cell wall anchor domain-containing protein [Actinomycetota bacterium]|nr:LPXTG cell wall anchor domain-containing protein [Actinomycetota bacterium]